MPNALARLASAWPIAAHPDDPETATLQAGAEEHEHPPLPRLVRADDPLALPEAPRDHQDQRHRDVGRRVGQHTWSVGGDHAALTAFGDVDVVVADGDVGDDLQLRAGRVEERPVDLGGQQGQHSVGMGDTFVQLVDLDRLVVLPAPHVAVRTEHVEAGVRDSTGHDDPRLRHQAASIHSRSLPRPSSMSATEMPE